MTQHWESNNSPGKTILTLEHLSLKMSGLSKNNFFLMKIDSESIFYFSLFYYSAQMCALLG